MTTSIFFLLGLSFMTMHEMDAVRKREWVIISQPLKLDDTLAYRVFTLVHLPALMLMFWALPSPNFQIGLSIFMIFHAMVHFALRKYQHFTFDRFSYLLIYAPIITSVLHLLLVYNS